MERLTYDFCIGGNHCWQVKGADNLECREVCERQGDDGCKTCPIAKAFDRLAAIEDILGDEYDLERLREMVEADKTLKEFAEDVARQFGYHGTTADGRPGYTCGGLSTLEWAWNILDWPDPKPAPECECQEEGCHEWATGGRPTPDGYKWLCGRHFAAYEALAEAQAALRREQDD